MTDPSATVSSSAARSAEPRSIWRSPWLWAVLAGLILIPAMRPLLRFEPDPPPHLGRVPAFSLTDAYGDGFGTPDLEGRVWIADFFFTRCGSICPKLTAAMSRLDRRFRESGIHDVHLVSISVDPQYDTPAVLAGYAESWKIDPDRWSLLTGEEAAVQALVVDGFKTAMGPAQPMGDGLVDIAHAGKFVLVDARGEIRGYYDIDELGLDELFHRSRHVLGEAKRGAS